MTPVILHETPAHLRRLLVYGDTERGVAESVFKPSGFKDELSLLRMIPG